MSIHLVIILLNAIYVLTAEQEWQRFGMNASSLLRYGFISSELEDFNDLEALVPYGTGFGTLEDVNDFVAESFEWYQGLGDSDQLLGKFDNKYVWRGDELELDRSLVYEETPPV